MVVVCRALKNVIGNVIGGGGGGGGGLQGFKIM